MVAVRQTARPARHVQLMEVPGASFGALSLPGASARKKAPVIRRLFCKRFMGRGSRLVAAGILKIE